MVRRLIRNHNISTLRTAWRTSYGVKRSTQYAVRGTKKGFSLLEVLLAIFLLGAGFTSLLQVLNAGLFTSGQNEDEIVAAYLAQEKTEEIQNATFTSITSEAKAAVSGFPAFSRQVAVSTPQTDLNQVTVTVYWHAGNAETNLSITTYVSNA